MDADAQEQVDLSEQPVVCGTVKLEQILQLLLILGESAEHTFFAVVGGNQTMGVVLPKC